MDTFAPPESAPHDVQNARLAAILGLISMGMAMSACCTSIFGIMGSAVMGVVALFLARQVLAEDPSGEALAYANVGLWAGLVSTAWGLVVFIAFSLYIVVYVIFVAVAIGAGL